MNVIRSHLHDMYTEEVNKVALSADDDKRWIKEDSTLTLAYEHYKIGKYSSQYTDIVWIWDLMTNNTRTVSTLDKSNNKWIEHFFKPISCLKIKKY